MRVYSRRSFTPSLTLYKSNLALMLFRCRLGITSSRCRPRVHFAWLSLLVSGCQIVLYMARQSLDCACVGARAHLATCLVQNIHGNSEKLTLAKLFCNKATYFCLLPITALFKFINKAVVSQLAPKELTTIMEKLASL